MFESFEEFLAVSAVQIPIGLFIGNLLITAVLALILSRIYVIYGSSLSNRSLFSRNFLLITMTTMLIISVVKSSLALSLGLVGALSIIRFRAAIKEPEELAYLFLTIAVGLGFGANQGLITLIAFTIIVLIIIATKKLLHKDNDNQNLHLTISTHDPQNIGADEIVDTLKKHSSAINLIRLDESNEILEISVLVEFSNFEQLNETKHAIKKISNKLKFSFLDNKGII